MKRAAAPWNARPRSVRAAVSAARAGRGALRALEALLLFAAGMLVTASAALLSQATGREAAGVAWIGGGLCAAAWWLEHALGLGATARALDRRLGAQGALATAFELEQRRTELRPLEELLRQRVLAPLRLGPLLGALRPSFWVPLGAPVAAGVLFALVLNARGAPPAPDDARVVLSSALSRALDAAQRELERSAPRAEGPAARAALAELRAVLARAGAPAPAPDARAELARAGAELDRRLAELGVALEPRDELAAPLAAARLWLDALRASLAAGPNGPGPRDEHLTRGPAQGTISGSNPAPNPPADPMPNAAAPVSADSSAAEALATQQGTWWPAEDDAVVAQWLARSRAAREGEAR
ncbi:MAG: hypothetical protein EXS08_00070 [Planctomycetes bacterium]|nr:hypothetical protein [Planctomycetota bacterium]